jgi:aspartate kinase
MKKVVLKFGGTSMGTSDSIGRCAGIVAKAAQSSCVVVVVSALSGVTDTLLRLISLTKLQKPKLISAGVGELENRHRQALVAFVEPALLDQTWQDEFTGLFRKLRLILTGASFVGDITDRSTALVCSFGEQLSSRIMQHALSAQGCAAQVIDARRVVRTDSQYLEAAVNFPRTRARFRHLVLPLLRRGSIAVVPGFVGQDAHGNITLLGRGGSDYSASIAAVSLDAAQVEIWTDVDGIMSADPRVVKRGVRTWEKIELPVVAEMAHSGAKVLHPKTITAAVKQDIPVVVRNTFRPNGSGTIIVPRGNTPGLRGIVVERGQAVCHFTEPGMLDSFGFIHRCTEVFVRHGVPIDTCATSEVTFSCSLRQSDLHKKLLTELTRIAEVKVIHGLAKVCIIGNEVMNDPGIVARIMRGVPKESLQLMSLGASRMNITLLVAQDDAEQVLKSLHASLFPSSR